jgi:hypothetical protein
MTYLNEVALNRDQAVRETELGMRLARSCVATVLVMLLAWSATMAQAQDAVARAREYFEAADVAADEGRVADAVRLYRESLELAPRAGTAYNLAVVLAAAGRTVEAVNVVHEILNGRYGEISDSLFDRVEALASEVESRVAVLVLRLEGPAGSSLRIDGELTQIELGVPQEVRLDPGVHRLLARGPRGELVEREIDVMAGTRREIELAIEAIADAGGSNGQEIGIGGGNGEVDVGRNPPESEQSSLWNEPWLHIGLGLALTAGVVALGLGLSGVFEPAPSDRVWGHAEALVRF